MSTCPGCGAASTRHGTKSRRVLDLDSAGGVVNASLRVQRWRCVACQGYHTELPPTARPRSPATIAARDAIAEACFGRGYAGAALHYGVDEKTARSMWQEWAALREADLPAGPPACIGLHTATAGGQECTLVTDVANMALIDVLRGSGQPGGELETWMLGMLAQGNVDIAALGFSVPLRSLLAHHAPRTQVVVCPLHARRQGMAAFVGAFRVATRGRARGCNVRPQPRVFAQGSSGLVDHEREEMSAWDDAVLELYQAKERYMQALDTNDARTALAILDDAGQQALGLPGGAAPARLIAAWRQEMAGGVEMASLDPFAHVLSTMASLWARRRPPLPFDLARGLAVLRDGPRVVQADEEGCERTLGVAMHNAISALGG